MTETTLHTLKLPPRFYDDHSDRDLPSGRVIKRSLVSVTIECDDEALAEIASDAKYYATQFEGEDWARNSDGRAIVRSAKATLGAIARYRARAAK